MNILEIENTVSKLGCRPYQKNYVIGNFKGWLDFSTSLNVAATGAGKTWIGASTIRCWLDHVGTKVLWIAHRRELNRQAIDSIEAITGVKPDLEMGEHRAGGDRGLFHQPARVVVASIQSLMAGPKCKSCNGSGGVLVPCKKCSKREEPIPDCKYCEGTGQMGSPDISCPDCTGGRVRRLQNFNPDEFGLIITDEGHRSLAESYKRTYRWFGRNQDSKFLMLTATPFRSDEQSLGDLCDFVPDVHGNVCAGVDAEKAEIADIAWCIREGWLAPVVQRFIECTTLDLREVGTSKGELATGDLEAVMLNERTLHEMVAGTLQFCGDKKTVIFCVDRSHAQSVTEMLNRPGYKPGSARMVTGETPEAEREEIISGHKDGEFQFLVNVDIVTEGYDDPEIEVVVMMRPRKTKGPYIQCVGRGTRPINKPRVDATALERQADIATSKKPFCEIIDFHGHNGKHKLITMLDVMGTGSVRQEVLDRAKKIGMDEDAAERPEDLLSRAEAELLAEEQKRLEEEEASRRRAVVARKAEFRVTKADPFAWIDDVVSNSVNPNALREASFAQKSALERMGVSPVEVEGMTFQKATLMLQQLTRRRQKGLCTYKQMKLLEKRQIDATNMSMKQASEVIDAIAHNGWKVTDDIRELAASFSEVE